jgi:G patch domain-containing protein 1
MDEEDRADAEEAKSIQTADTFARFGVTKPNTGLDEGLAELMRAGGNTIGLQLLRKMGWKDGQGIGPRVRRIARLDDTFGNGHNATGSTHFFAPDDINLSQIKQMVGRGGLGYEGQSRSTFAPSSLNLRKPFGVDNKGSNPPLGLCRGIRAQA